MESGKTRWKEMDIKDPIQAKVSGKMNQDMKDRKGSHFRSPSGRAGFNRNRSQSGRAGFDRNRSQSSGAGFDRYRSQSGGKDLSLEEMETVLDPDQKVI